MGKRKKSSRGPAGPKKREPLNTTFTCLFCNHEKAIVVKMDKKNGYGLLTCKICGQKFQHKTSYLDAPVDVYAGWIDACEHVAKEQADKELGRIDEDDEEAGGASALDKEFSTYGTRADGDEDEDLDDNMF